MSSMRTPRISNAVPFAAAIGVMITVVSLTAFGFEPETLPPDTAAVIETPSAEQPAPEAPTELAATLVGEFVVPVEVVSRPGDDRIFVAQLLGQIVVADGDEIVTVLDIADQVSNDGEHGLLGAAFHPELDFLYVHYSDLDGTSIVAEYAVDPATGLADRSSERRVLSVDQPYNNHNGGELTFGPDGFLYLGLGDGGLADDPDRSALDLGSRLGKILRIDPRPGEAGAPFTVPVDNPFVDTPGADPTIWSYGLRNPWRFSFDEATGDLWIADVGQDQFEEINRAVAGDEPAGLGMSFGWSAFEGFAAFNSDQPSDGHTDPFLTYERSDGNCSISGGAVYRGTTSPGLNGWYLFGDYCSGLIWGIDTEAAGAPEMVQLGQVDALVAIATGGDGEIYAVSVAGGVYRLS